MRKGILLLGSYPPPFGGIGSHIQYLAPYLSSQGYDIHIFSLDPRKSLEKGDGFSVYRFAAASRREKIATLMSHVPGVFKINRRLKALGLDCWRERLDIAAYSFIMEDILPYVEKNNIVLISAYHLFQEGLFGALLSERLSIPLIVTNFGEIYASPKLYREKLRAVVGYICDRSSKLLSSSHHCAKSYNQIGIQADVEVVPYGIDINHFSPHNDGACIRRNLGIGSTDKIVLFTGRMIKDMGLHTFLAAIPRVLQVGGNIKFVITGGRGELFASALELQSQHKGDVFVVPDLSFRDLPLYYACASIVTAPTPDERACMGMAIKEGMAAGRPVIAARSGGIPEAVIDSETGVLVEPEEPEALAEAILTMARNDEAMKSMGWAGRKRAEALFNKDLTNRRIADIFNEVSK